MDQLNDRALAWQRYSEICTDIRTTDDISFKILGLVPFVSVTALATIIGTHQLRFPALIYIGVFGAVLTFGFYRWELRNIENCTWLTQRAGEIEKESLGLFPGEGKLAGQFYGAEKPPVLFGWLRRFRRSKRYIRIGKGGAEHIIYSATILAWLSLPIVARLT